MNWLFSTLLLFQLTFSITPEQDTAYLKTIRNLASSSTWLTLGQYHKSIFGRYQSMVSSSSFFLDSLRGPSSPQMELEATIRAFFKPVPDSADLHAICRFPARKNWLIQQGVIHEENLPSPVCKSLDQWIGNKRHSSISIVFATGYLINPASYFGHLFLKFNTYPIRTEENLINRTVNFGADLRSKDNPFIYVMKGLGGGYSGLYSQNDYYTQKYQYGENQLRDLWEFELNLPNETVDTLSIRIWELFGKKYRYYFFNENCAYYIIKPLEDLLEIKFLPPFLPYSLPKHVVESITSKQLPRGIPLVRDLVYIPSRQAVFYTKYSELNPLEKRVFEILISTDNPKFQEKTYADLSVKSKNKTLDVLIDYHDYINAGTLGVLKIEEQRRQIILERLNLPPVSSDDFVFSKVRNKSPGEAPKTNLIGLGVGISKNSKKAILRWRPANHDFLSDNSGRSPNSELQVFDMEAYVGDGAIGINQYDLMNVRALNSTTTGLPGDGDFAWSVRLGYGEEQIGCNYCGVFLANAFYGYAFGNTANIFLPYLFAGGQVQSPHQGSGYTILEFKGGVLSNGSGRFGFHTEGGWKFYLDGSRSQNLFLESEIRFTVSRILDLRIKAGYEFSPSCKLNSNFYW